MHHKKGNNGQPDKETSNQQKQNNMRVKEWQSHTFDSRSYRTPDYEEFEAQCVKEIKAQCKKHNINLHKVNKGHFQFSVVLERNGKFVYVSISDVRTYNPFDWTNWYKDVLIRTMEHDKDWGGGCNNFCNFEKIGETADKMLS